jgi:hypothetical protein
LKENTILIMFIFISFMLFGNEIQWESELLTQIRNTPLRSLQNHSNVILEFPTPEGDFIQFKIFETPVMPQKLALRFPQIKTYSGRGIQNPNDRVSVTLNGNSAKILIQNKNRNIFIDKMNDGEYRISYSEYGVENDIIENQLSSCGCGGEILASEITDNTNRSFPYCVGEDEPCFEIGNNLVTFRYAGILTAEANNSASDGTVSGGLAWIASMVNQINLVWVRDLSFRLEMIENSDLLIYTDDNPTPVEFTDHNMYDELSRVLTHIEDVIGPGGYATSQQNLEWEYGAVFNTGYGGGLAYVPGSTSANLPSYEIHIHEIGHNIGSSHNCTSEGGWACSFGGTAMCSRSNTLSGNSGDQYSSHTIDIAIRYQNQPFGGSNYDYQLGYTQELTNNSIPDITVPTSGFYIPKDTPFKLEGSATDTGNDNLTYSWEQNDASDYGFSPPEFPPDTGPLFCSVDGNSAGNVRYFPFMGSLLTNNYATGNIEKLPFASREINMRLLVRDNDLYSGAFNYKNVRFNVDGNSGPFRVTSQSETETWGIATIQIITWDVANTDNINTVNCSEVDILLSVDYGENFDIVLDENISNDGMHEIFVPILPSLDGARIMVKSSDNIFFDINNSFIQIVNNYQPQIDIITEAISVTTPIDLLQNITREIENSGEPGSFLIYETYTEIDYDGDGYLSFDGQNDYVDLGANLLGGNGDFTISLWVKSQATNAVIIQQRNGGFNGEYQLKFNGNGQLDMFTYRNGYQWSVVSSNLYNDNNWHHVVAVQDININGGYLFVDGVEIGSSSGGIVYLEGSIHSYLGADMRDYNKYLNGDINDVHIFNSSLNDNEINEIYLSGIGFNPIYNQGDYISSNTLVASYPITAMSGSILNDVSGEHNGEIYGANWNGDLIPTPNWLSVESNNNWLGVGQSEIIQINITPTNLEVNVGYIGKLIIASNVNTIPLIIPVHINTTNSGILGDINLDGVVNIIDIVQIVNLVLNTEYISMADINDDGIINIIDIVQLVNIILNN